MSVFELWLPIVMSGIATHLASTLAWTVLPHHKPEWQKLPAEDGLRDLLDQRQIAAGQYLFPHAHGAEQMASPEYKEKLATRCRGMLVLWATPPNMGRAIALTFAYFLVVAFATGYIASVAFAPAAARIDVFRLVFTVGLLCHAASPFPAVFWFRQRWAMNVLDGVAYAVITAGLFAWLWPGAN